jgi:hypothetical protein
VEAKTRRGRIAVTHDEGRTQCIGAMAAATYELPDDDGDVVLWADASEYEKEMEIAWATAAFDSLHGIATVNLPEATEEMRAAAYEEERRAGINAGSALILFRVMAAAGDLTKPSEKKT